MTTPKPTIPAQNLDVRVRERLLGAGLLDAEALDAHLAELPDLEAQAEIIPIEQPALIPYEVE